MRELERALAAFGQGYAWHLDGFPTWQALLGGVRAACAADAHRPGTSPLTPEGAVVLAGRLSSTLEGGARVLVVDSDPRLADALIGLGHTVTAWVPPANMPLWAGAHARHPEALSVIERGLHEAAPEDEHRAVAGAIVDVSGAAEQWTPRLSIALWSTAVGGRVAVVLHPQQREHGRQQLPRLPAVRSARHDECAARLIACDGRHGLTMAMSDYPADAWILDVEDGKPPLLPSKPWRAEALDEHDPTFARHGICEFHDVAPDVEADALGRALALGAERAQVAVRGGHGHEGQGYVHRFVGLAGGGHITATLERSTGIVTCGVWKWTPALESALTSGFLDALPRIDRAVRLPARV
jgi:hypothetical protein